eukprot:3812258-Prymnesium_polylepis.3
MVAWCVPYCIGNAHILCTTPHAENLLAGSHPRHAVCRQSTRLKQSRRATTWVSGHKAMRQRARTRGVAWLERRLVCERHSKRGRQRSLCHLSRCPCHRVGGSSTRVRGRL